MIVSQHIPSNLADDAIMPEVYGHYGASLKISTLAMCRQEVIARGKDYINCRTSLDNNNVEMKAIRTLNK